MHIMLFAIEPSMLFTYGHCNYSSKYRMCVWQYKAREELKLLSLNKEHDRMLTGVNTARGIIPKTSLFILEV